MKQQEINFFWPLTEQIPLDLDFSQCSPHQYYLKAQGQPREGPFATGMVYANFPTTIGNITIKGADICLDVETTTVKVKSSPHLLRRILYNILGIKWEIK